MQDGQGPIFGTIVVTLAIAVVAAGCVARVPRDEEVPQPGTLAFYAGCNIHYSDGTPWPCEPRSEMLATEASPPPGWSCTVANGSRSAGTGTYLALYRSSDGSAAGVEFDAGVPRDPVFAFLEVGAPADPTTYHWSGPGRGFVRLPEAPRNVELRLLVSSVEIRSDTPALRGATPSLIWSLHEDAERSVGPHWYALVLDAGSERYTFEGGNVAGSGPAYFDYWSTRTGEDFEFSVNKPHNFAEPIHADDAGSPLPGLLSSCQ